MTVLLVSDDREYLCAPGEELQTDLGVLTVPDDPEPGDVVETHLGTSFTVRRLRLPDLFAHFERTGAPMLPRDVGLVIGQAGIGAGDRVLDVGTGTGVLAAALGRIDADVITYERDPEFADVARANMALADVEDRVTVRTGDVREDLDDIGTFDAMTLDTADAPAIVESAPDLLMPGGSAVSYSPFVEDMRATVEAAASRDFASITTTETIQREMDVDERGTRPTTTGVGHTGYLTIARRE